MAIVINKSERWGYMRNVAFSLKERQKVRCDRTTCVQIDLSSTLGFSFTTEILLQRRIFQSLAVAFVYSADVDLHICSISSDAVNTAATEAIATLDSIYDTSNTDTGPSLRSITPDSGTTVSLRNRNCNPPHPRDSRTSRTDFRVKLSRLAYRGSAQLEIFAANYSSASKPQKYRCSLIRPL